MAAGGSRGAASSESRLHRESLLRIPLVQRAFSHRSIRARSRAFDRTWGYEGIVTASQVGFLPLSQEFFYGSISKTATWRRRAGTTSARAFNEDDRLVSEVFFCVHDFLHAWSLVTLREVVPHLRVHPGMSAREREELTFAHLVTEAVATVGLDYWYLSVVDPNDVCPIGTRTFPLTTDYRERNLREYRRARPRLVVQQPAFLDELTRFYCDGVFRGVDRDDIVRSPLLKQWLSHEVKYGERQRSYFRAWLAFLCGEDDPKNHARPVETPAWGRELVALLSKRLWRLVKENSDDVPFTRAAVPVERGGPPDAFDPRFMNVRVASHEQLARAAARFNDTKLREILCDQYVSTFVREDFDPALLPALARAREARDIVALFGLMKGTRRVETSSGEPSLLFLLT